MKIINTIILVLVFQVCYSQKKNIIRESLIYSLKDTIGVDFSNINDIEKWIWYKRSYDFSGNLLEEISYPFPHNPSYKITKIKRIEEKGDTIITTILNGDEIVASQTKCYQKNKIRTCVSRHYALLNSSSFSELNPYFITRTVQDSIRNESQIITVSTDGIVYDTLKNIKQPLTNRNDQNEIFDFIKTDSIKNKDFNSFGYIYLKENDTLAISSTIIFNYDENFKVQENIYFDLENNSKRKTITTFQNELVVKKENYNLTSGGWEISNITSNEYNQKGDIELKIRDDYRVGKWSYRYVTYSKHKYYE